MATNMQCSSSRSRMVFAAMCSGVEATLESALASLHLSGPIRNRDVGAHIAAPSDLTPKKASLPSDSVKLAISVICGRERCPPRKV